MAHLQINVSYFIASDPVKYLHLSIIVVSQWLEFSAHMIYGGITLATLYTCVYASHLAAHRPLNVLMLVIALDVSG